jgi:LysM repeat protein
MYERVTKKIVIDPYRGGDDIGNTADGLVEKDFNLKISNYIYNRLKDLGVPVSITRNDDSTIDIDSRVNKIKSFYGSGNDVIVISNALTTGENGSSIVYALRNNDELANKIANEIEKTGQSVDKFYQRRLPSDTSKDYNQLIRDTANNESLIIYYGNTSNSSEVEKLINNTDDLGEAVVIALLEYLNLSYTSNDGNNYYKVVSGDSLYSIAKKYNTTVDNIKSLNNLTSNNLSIGQVLKIPSSTNTSSNYITYKVVSGDSLYSISKKYNTTVDNIKSLNNLTSNNLSIGQILKIPSSSTNTSSNYITYKVVSGDSLYSIAKKYNTTVNEIKNLNNLSSNLLNIGQTLKIPN